MTHMPPACLLRRRAPLVRGAPALRTKKRPSVRMQKRPRWNSSEVGSSLPHPAASVTRGLLRKKSDYDMRTRRPTHRLRGAERVNAYVYTLRLLRMRKAMDLGEPPLGQWKVCESLLRLCSGGPRGSPSTSGRKSAQGAPGRTQTDRPELP